MLRVCMQVSRVPVQVQSCRPGKLFKLAMNMSSTSLRRPKISLVGSGQIGAIAGLLVGMKKLGDVHMFDVVSGVPMGKALDLAHLSVVEQFDCHFTGGSGEEGLEGSDLVIVTAGVPRKPGMSRDDLLGINAKIVTAVAGNLKKYCSKAFVICITNPLDAMVQLLQRESGLPTSMVVGMAGVLDAARYKAFLAERLNVSVENVHALVMGGHGDTMVPLPRFTSIEGIPLMDIIKMGWLSEQELQSIIQRTRNGGQEIVEHLKTGSAFFAPAASAVQMAEAYLRDEKSLLPCAAFLSGEYGVSGLYVGVPVILGRGGVEKVVELSLSPEEKTAFQHSVDSVQTLVEALDKASQNQHQSRM